MIWITVCKTIDQIQTKYFSSQNNKNEEKRYVEVLNKKRKQSPNSY